LYNYLLLKCSGAALIIYQLSVYPTVERACGPVGLARTTGVSFHQIVAIISFLTFQFFLLLEICLISLVPCAGVINSSFAKLPPHSIVVWRSTNHSLSYCFSSKEYPVCKCTSLFISDFECLN